MANFFPCPNPTCTYQFDADQLPAAAMVTCPMCRTRFPYRASAPAADQRDETSDNPWAGGAESRTETEAPPSRPNRLVTPRYMPKSNKTQTMLLIVGFSAVVATVLIVIMFNIKRNPFRSGGDSSDSYTDDELNFRFRTFEKDKWKEDKGLRNRMSASGFVQKRADDSAWIVLHAKDYGKKNPRRGEMRTEMIAMLRSAFGRGFQKEPIQGTMAGQAVDAIQFQGDLNDTPMFGEGYAFHHRGIGYILVIFAPTASWKEARAELDGLRKSFEFANARDKWQETEPSIIPHIVDQGRYQIDDADGVWERAVELPKDEEDPLDPMPKKKAPLKKGSYVVTSLKDKDEKATIAFRATFPVKPKFKLDLNPKAEALVLVLNKAEGDPLEAARAYMFEKLKKDEGGDVVEVTLKPLDKSPSGLDIPQSHAKVGIFQSTNSVDRSAKKFYTIAALTIGDNLVVAVAWCPDRDAEYMEPYMLNLVSSLHERK